MLRRVEVLHVRRADEICRLIKIVAANGTTPVWSVVLTIWHENGVTTVKILANGFADVADWDCENALEARTLNGRVNALGEHSADALGPDVGSVVVACIGVGRKRGRDNVLYH